MRLSSTLVPVRWLAFVAILLAATAPAATRLVQPVSATTQPPADAQSQPTRTGRGSWTTFVDGQRVQMRWTGAFRLSADQRAIEWVEPGASVTITNGARWFATGVEIKALDGGQLEPHYFRGGFERPFDPDGREFLLGALERVTLGTGLNADAAVARALEEGGADAVRAAIGSLRTDAARRAYYQALIEQGQFAPAGVVGIVREASATLESSSSLATMLRAAGPRVAADEASTVALIEMSKQVSSDSAQLQVLRALMPEQVSPGVAAALLDAASTLGNDSSRYNLLQDVASRGGLTPETRQVYFTVVDSLQSSSYRGRLLSEVGTGANEPGVTVAVLDAARAVNSDTERRRIVAATMAGDAVAPTTAPQVLAAVTAVRSDTQRAALLQEFIKKGGLTAATAPAFFPLVANMSSGTYQHRVLDDVTAMPTLPAEVVTGFLEAAARVRGDQSRSEVLMTFIARHAIAGADRERYLVAADGIDSETYQNRVLAALVRAERARR